MLVLSRKSGEAIRIGDNITLTVVSVKGNRVRIGIEAPSECRILRDEVEWDLSNRVTEPTVAVAAEHELVLC